MDFKEMLEKRAENLKIDLTNIDRAYRDFDKQEDSKWKEFLKSPFIEGANFENNNFSYLSTHIPEYEEQLKEEYGKVIAAGGKELEDFNKKTQSFIAAKSKLEEAKAKRITFEKIETERKIASAKAIFKAVADMKEIIDEQIKIINEQLTKTYKELQGVSYTDSKYQELNDKISELMKVQKPFFNHANLLDAIEKSHEMLDTTFVRRFKVGKDYYKMYDEIAIKSSELRTFRNDELTLNVDVLAFVERENIIKKTEEKPEQKPNEQETSMKTNPDEVIEELEFSQEQDLNNPTEVAGLSNENKDGSKSEDEEVVTPTKVRKLPLKARRVLFSLAGTAIGGGIATSTGIAGSVITLTVAGLGKIVVKKALNKNEDRENRLKEIEDNIKHFIPEDENTEDYFDQMTEEEKLEFEALTKEAHELSERLQPNYKDERYMGPAKVKSFTDAKEKLNAKVNKLKAYLGSNDGLKEINTFLNAAIVSSVTFGTLRGVITMLDYAHTGVEAGSLVGKILENPGAVEVLKDANEVIGRVRF